MAKNSQRVVKEHKSKKEKSASGCSFRLQPSALIAGDFTRIHFAHLLFPDPLKKNTFLGKQGPTEEECVQIGPVGVGGAGPEALTGNIPLVQ